MLHVLEDSISILNTSRIQISENRQTINNLSRSINRINERIDDTTKMLQTEIIELEQFVQMYLQLDLVIEETKRTVSNAQKYMEHLQLQLNMLSLGHLSPSVITPKSLKNLLIEMRSKLPHHLTLPDDPERQLWKYYQSLTCTTILDKGMFLVVVNLPLIDRDHKFEIYQVINSPFPYKLESSALAINPEKTRYIILDQAELAHCSTPLLDYCNVKSSLFPVNLSKLCIIALFMMNKENVGKYCQTDVIPNSLLPKATYVFDGIWIIATQIELTFSIVCPNGTRVEKVKPPMTVLNLDMGCSASNDYVTLMPYYHKESTYVVSDIYSELLKLNNKTEFKIWKPFTVKLPNFTSIEVPEELKVLEKIPMGHLIDRLHNMRNIVKDNGTPEWVYYLIGALSALLVVIAALVYYNKGRYLRQLCSAKRSGKFLTPTAPPGYQAVPAKTGDGLHIQIGADSPRQVLLQTVQQNENPVSKPTVYPMMELTKSS